MTEHARPPFVLAFAADMQGCGYHRIAVPMVSMIVAGVADFTFGQIRFRKASSGLI